MSPVTRVTTALPPGAQRGLGRGGLQVGRQLPGSTSANPGRGGTEQVGQVEGPVGVEYCSHCRSGNRPTPSYERERGLTGACGVP